MTALNQLDTATKAVIDYAIRIVASRMLAHPRIDDDPAPVIVNERDKILDELWCQPDIDAPVAAHPVAALHQTWLERNGVKPDGRGRA